MKDELIDIELPVSPSMDWWFFVELTLFVVVLLALFFTFWWFRRVFWGSLKKQYILNQQIKELADEKNCSIKQSLQANQLFISAKKQQQLSTDAIQKLSLGFNNICFSGENVSCETLRNLLVDFLEALKQNQPTLIDSVKQITWWQK